MGENVGNISELAFLYILFDRVQRFLCRDLEIVDIMKEYWFTCVHVVCMFKIKKALTYLVRET